MEFDRSVLDGNFSKLREVVEVKTYQVKTT